MSYFARATAIVNGRSDPRKGASDASDASNVPKHHEANDTLRATSVDTELLENIMEEGNVVETIEGQKNGEIQQPTEDGKAAGINTHDQSTESTQPGKSTQEVPTNETNSRPRRTTRPPKRYDDYVELDGPCTPTAQANEHQEEPSAPKKTSSKTYDAVPKKGTHPEIHPEDMRQVINLIEKYRTDVVKKMVKMSKEHEQSKKTFEAALTTMEQKYNREQRRNESIENELNNIKKENDTLKEQVSRMKHPVPGNDPIIRKPSSNTGHHQTGLGQTNKPTMAEVVKNGIPQPTERPKPTRLPNRTITVVTVLGWKDRKRTDK